MLPQKKDYSATIEELFRQIGNDGKPKTVKTFTFQVTNDCSLCCSYCYEINKGKNYMTFETAKRTIDYILEQAKRPDSILSYERNSGIIIDIIGGEPLLCIDMILQLIEYFELRLMEEDSPWLLFHRYSFSTNGVAYRNSKVQEMIEKYGDLLSLSVTVDGYEELHDSCRLFPTGEGSYKIAIDAALDQLHRFGNDTTKVTLCPENIDKLYLAAVNMIELGFKHINANCVFEEGWSTKDAQTLYEQMKLISDYILDNDLEDKVNISLYNERNFAPMNDSEEDNRNWCGGTSAMIAVDYKGDFYPCLRYMESSLPKNREPFTIGSLDKGLYETEEDREKLSFLRDITRISQSTDECINCPIARGCAWCSGYNYAKFGTPNKRAIFICVMHKARALANLYYWQREAKKKNIPCKFVDHLPKEEAIRIIGEEEYVRLKEVS